jgi:hypothetical protein
VLLFGTKPVTRKGAGFLFGIRGTKGVVGVSDGTNEILAALVMATPERKAAALRALRGEFEFAQKARVIETEAYLTLREIGRQLGISACSLWRYGVPGHEMGGRRRFRMSEVVAYLDSEEFKARAEELKEERREKVQGDGC